MDSITQLLPPPPPHPSPPAPPPPPPPPLTDISPEQDIQLKKSLKRMLENRLQPKTDENDVKFRFYSTHEGESFQVHSFPSLSLPSSSHFSPRRPTKLVAHGNKGLTDVDLLFSQAYKEAGIECNLVGIDWRELEGSAHLRVVQAGRQAARLIEVLVKDASLRIEDIHAIGFSYGAHVVANASKELQKLGLSKIPRITALDPGRHGFNEESSDSIRLCKEDAELVDVIHTSRIGFQDPLGHLDFYPNGGEAQVCDGAGDKINFCDLQAGGGWEHQRAVQYFQESILGSHKFLSWRGDSWQEFISQEDSWEEFISQEDNGQEFISQKEKLRKEPVSMGEHLCCKGVPKEGKYFLKTNGKKLFSLS